MNTEEAIRVVSGAKGFAELFSGEVDDARKLFKKLSRLTHPDLVNGSHLKVEAGNAFIKLNQYWEQFNQPHSVKKNVIKTKKHEYVLGDKFVDADGFVTVAATYDSGHEKAFVSYPKNSRDNDLNKNAATILKELNQVVPEEFSAFFPSFMEGFRDTSSGKEKFFITTKVLDRKFYTLADVKAKYVNGVHPKDVAWIFRRVLVALGNTHDAGFVHNAPVLDSFFIQPEEHGLVLAGWQYAGNSGEKMTGVPISRKDMYPSFVMNSKTGSPAGDIAVAAKTVMSLLPVDSPSRLRAFLKGCQTGSVPPAVELLAEFDEILVQMWGPKKFHPFTMEF